MTNSRITFWCWFIIFSNTWRDEIKVHPVSFLMIMACGPLFKWLIPFTSFIELSQSINIHKFNSLIISFMSFPLLINSLNQSIELNINNEMGWVDESIEWSHCRGRPQAITKEIWPTFKLMNQLIQFMNFIIMLFNQLFSITKS